MADDPTTRTSARHVLLAGGGSGGHVFPALAVGDALGKRGWRVSFAGRPVGMERELVARRSLEYVALAARPMVGRSIAGRLAAVWTLGRSAWRARRWVRAHGVTAVVGTGGYAAAPAVLGAAWAGRPAILVEPNARAGAANRWLAKRARVAALAYESAAGDLACESFIAGVPVRDAFFAVPALEASAPRRLLVLGGSQGSAFLNELVPAALARLGEAAGGLDVVHQAGERHAEATRARWAEVAPGGATVSVVAFVDDVPAALGAASLVVSRAGANALAELCASGRPSILVPLRLAGAHQAENAKALAEAGAAWVLGEADATPERFAALLAERLADPDGLAAAGLAARTLARPGAAAAIADRVEREAEAAR